MRLPPRVTLVEVGPRDGLQDLSSPPHTIHKIAFIDRLSEAGVPVVEVGAFVHPRRVPAMADSEAVVRGITMRPGTRYTALVPNLRGLARAIGAGLREVSVFGA
ncbi:MAG: hydroxymethylglutaryl-CoA lyase, partial [Vicinamibacterales bacterium]